MFCVQCPFPWSGGGDGDRVGCYTCGITDCGEGGVLDADACACVCLPGHGGATCESELIAAVAEAFPSVDVGVDGEGESILILVSYAWAIRLTGKCFVYRRVHFARFVGPRRGRRRRRGRPRRGSHRLARRARWLDRGDLHRRAVRGGEHAVRARFQRHGSRRSRCVYFYVRIGNRTDVVFCVQGKWTGYRASFTTLPRMPTRGARTPRSGRRMPRVGEFFLLYLSRTGSSTDVVFCSTLAGTETQTSGARSPRSGPISRATGAPPPVSGAP